MAKTFDPSQLSPADRAAYANWQQQFKAYTDASGGGVPAPVTYALAHPEYLQDHPELIPGWRIASGADLPPAVREATKGYHPVWDEKSGGPGFDKNSGLWSKWETYLQLGLAAAVAAPVVIPALAGGGVATGAGGGAAAGTGAGATVPALEGGTTLATNLGASSALGPLGTTAATTSATVPALEGGKTLAANLGPSSAINAAGPAPAAAPSSFWDKVLGKSTSDKVTKLLGIGGGLTGALIQSNQADKATQAQQEAAAKALELQSNIYQQQRADLAPYRQAGASSLSALTYGLGLDPSKSADTTTPYFQQQFAAQQNAVPQNAQRNPNSPTTQPIPAGNYTGGQAVPRVSSLAPTASDGTVSMFAPDGRQARVPQNQVQAALNAGGRLA